MSAQDDLNAKLAANHAQDDADTAASYAIAKAQVAAGQAKQYSQAYIVTGPQYYNAPVYKTNTSNSIETVLYQSGSGSVEPNFNNILTYDGKAVTVSKDCGCLLVITSDDDTNFYVETINLETQSVVGSPVAVVFTDGPFTGSIQDVAYSTELEKYLVVANSTGAAGGTGDIYELNADTGDLTFIADVGLGPSGSASISMTAAPTGELYVGFYQQGNSSHVFQITPNSDDPSDFSNFRSVYQIGGGADYGTSLIAYTFDDKIVVSPGNASDWIQLATDGTVLATGSLAAGGAPAHSMAAKPLMNDWFLYVGATVTRVYSVDASGTITSDKYFNSHNQDVTDLIVPTWLQAT